MSNILKWKTRTSRQFRKIQKETWNGKHMKATGVKFDQLKQAINEMVKNFNSIQ